MEDHFVLHVDTLLRESTAAEGRNLLAEKTTKNNSNGTINKPVDCRICHDEEEVYNMETPCSCCGTMKYAHRKCIQRWCDEKGDITCEICRRPFMPGYNATPKLFLHARTSMNLMTTAPFYRETIPSEFNEHSISRSILYCRSVALIFLLLLLLREALPTINNGSGQYSLQIFMMQLLRSAALGLPLYIMLRAVTTFQCRQQQLLQQEASEISIQGRT
ncbi:uncharacterized protein LOC110033356 [Phalaenopsis equestris]|uniref:uncharacterized protein LOC110033356 n=1 Tax=Phalaenopsis equestris TaxID=78828 RepID=UPI0009E35A64|nr:uncharacterized protein LOC110033356 [Phalaenopsis equestris]XP_020592952.1 uncharacterized protein LOC110033356 [Phalaenopsis equestris]